MDIHPLQTNKMMQLHLTMASGCTLPADWD